MYLSKKFYLTCPKCGERTEYEYYFGIFDDIFYSEGRFPNELQWECPHCYKIISLNSLEDSINEVTVDYVPFPFEYTEGGRTQETTLIADELSIYLKYQGEWVDIDEFFRKSE